MSTRNNYCAQCGQCQVEGDVEAPMLHLASKGIDSRPEDMRDYHLDCLPYDVEEMHRPHAGARIDAAKAGVRGDELRAIPNDTQEA